MDSGENDEIERLEQTHGKCTLYRVLHIYTGAVNQNLRKEKERRKR